MNLSLAVPYFLVLLTAASCGSILLVAGVAWLERRGAAAWRHFLWLLALAIPLGTLLLDLLPARWEAPLLPPVSMPRNAEVPPSEKTSDSLPPQTAPASAASPQIPARPSLAINLWFAIWLGGAGGIVFATIWARRRLGRLLRGSVPGPDTLRERLAGLIRKNGLKDFLRRPLQKRVDVWISEHTSVPFCCGWFRPAIVLPARWDTWPPDRLEACLVHELAHLHRGDLFSLALARTTCLLCWFNPLVWWAAEKLREEAERAADDLALEDSGQPTCYAAHLIAVAEDCRDAWRIPGISLPMARPGRLTTRVHAILDGSIARAVPKTGRLAAVSLVVAATLTTAMTVRLTAAPAAGADGPSLAKFPRQDRDEIWNQGYNAIQAGQIEVIESLLARKLDPNAELSAHSSLLFIAVDENREAIVKLLLAHGADVNRKTSWGDTAFRRACLRGNKAIADLLIKAGAPRDERLYATALGDVATLEKENASISTEDARKLLNTAVGAGQTASFDWLWKKLDGLDGTKKASLLGELFVKAAKGKQLGMMRHLEKHEASVKEHGTAALTEAVSQNSPKIARYLLEAGVSANETLPGHGNFLRDAAGEGHLEMVKLLLDHGVKIDVKDGQGNTPLMWAAYNGQSDICLLLLERGANPHLKNSYGQNAAWLAAGGAHCPDALEVLIKKGVDIKSRDTHGRSILHAMMYYGAPRPGKIAFPGKVYTDAETRDYHARERRTIDLLIAAGLDVNGRDDSRTPLITALGHGHHEAARALLDQGADATAVDEHGNSALMWAFTIAPLPVDVFERVLKAGKNPNPVVMTFIEGGPKPFPMLSEAIYYAANPNYEAAPIREGVKALLANGAIFPGTETPGAQNLLQAAARGDLPGVQAAVRRGASIDSAEESGWTALSISISLGYEENVNWLLDNGASAVTRERRSPVDLAIRRNRPELTEKLLTKGAKIAALDHSLYLAAEQNNQPLVELLLKLGANAAYSGNTMIQGEDGQKRQMVESFPLYSCIQNGNAQIARILLEKGADPDPQNLRAGQGLLHQAVRQDRAEIVGLLIEYGANPAAKDSAGESPLDLAQKEHKALVSVIQNARPRTR